MAKKFCRSEVDKDMAVDYELRSEFSLEMRKKSCKLGFIEIHLPEEKESRGEVKQFSLKEGLNEPLSI